MDPLTDIHENKKSGCRFFAKLLTLQNNISRTKGRENETVKGVTVQMGQSICKHTFAAVFHTLYQCGVKKGLCTNEPRWKNKQRKGLRLA